MEVYKRETTEIARRFLAHGLGYAHCVAALDAALAATVLRMKPEDLPEIRSTVLKNNRIVANERKRRAGPQKAASP